MKKHIQLLAFVLISLFVFSCSKDKDNPAPASALKVNGTSLKITQLYETSYYSQSSNKTRHYLYFATEGINVVPKEYYDEFTGPGKIYYMEVTSGGNNATLLAEKYANEDVYSEYYEVAGDKWNTLDDEIAMDGNVSITKSGDTYTISFKAKGGSTYEVNYTGTILPIRGNL